MRIVNGVLCILLLIFCVVQYNDPDGVYWGVLYLTGAASTGLAAFRPLAFGRVWLWICSVLALATAAVGVVFYWPRTPGFWRSEVWWETETAREGMGMMILFIAFGCAVFVAWRFRSSVRSD